MELLWHSYLVLNTRVMILCTEIGLRLALCYVQGWFAITTGVRSRHYYSVILGGVLSCGFFVLPY